MAISLLTWQSPGTAKHYIRPAACLVPLKCRGLKVCRGLAQKGLRTAEITLQRLLPNGFIKKIKPGCQLEIDFGLQIRF